MFAIVILHKIAPYHRYKMRVNLSAKAPASGAKAVVWKRARRAILCGFVGGGVFFESIMLNFCSLKILNQLTRADL